MESGTSVTTINHSIETSALSNISITEDDNGFESIRGFGNTPTEAMNDLHRNLI
ncbi:MAG: hypothetical protein ACI9UR_002777 [Bacteroidia bacterium]|jgi:hypothetical protein